MHIITGMSMCALELPTILTKHRCIMCLCGVCVCVISNFLYHISVCVCVCTFVCIEAVAHGRMLPCFLQYSTDCSFLRCTTHPMHVYVCPCAHIYTYTHTYNPHSRNVVRSCTHRAVYKHQLPDMFKSRFCAAMSIMCCRHCHVVSTCGILVDGHTKACKNTRTCKRCESNIHIYLHVHSR